MAVVIEPGNPHDFTQDELEELGAELREAEPDLDVQFAVREERGYGVGLIEVLHVFVENKDLILAGGGALAALVRWLKKRWEKDRRPRSVIFYGPDGEPVKNILVDAPDGDPVEESLPERRQAPKL